MIRIQRGPEPEDLTLARDEHLARARLRGGGPTTEEIKGYQVARASLAATQRYKCAWCELYLRDEGAPVEHYRPKGAVSDVDWSALQKVPARRKTDDDDLDDDRFAKGLPPAGARMDRVRWSERSGYWWLAWTWENALYACTGCNSGVKGTRFPQSKGASPLKALNLPPGAERALLLDPTDPTVDPMDHIRFRQSAGRWLPTARDGSPHGEWTIALLRLDRSPGLLTAYDTRVKSLDARAKRFDDLTHPSDTALQEAWTELLDDLLAPNELLLALAWDWLDQRYPEPWRTARNLALPRPLLRDAQPAGPPRPQVTALASLNGLPPTLADQIRVARNCAALPATSRNAHERSLKDLVGDILGHQPSRTDEELAELLRKSVDAIRRARR